MSGMCKQSLSRAALIVVSVGPQRKPSSASAFALFRYEVNDQQSTLKLKKRLGDGAIGPKDHLNTIYERSNEQGYIILHGKGKPSRLVEMDFKTGKVGRENRSFGKEAHSIQVSRKVYIYICEEKTQKKKRAHSTCFDSLRSCSISCHGDDDGDVLSQLIKETEEIIVLDSNGCRLVALDQNSLEMTRVLFDCSTWEPQRFMKGLCLVPGPVGKVECDKWRCICCVRMYIFFLLLYQLGGAMKTNHNNMMTMRESCHDSHISLRSMLCSESILQAQEKHGEKQTCKVRSSPLTFRSIGTNKMLQ